MDKTNVASSNRARRAPNCTIAAFVPVYCVSCGEAVVDVVDDALRGSVKEFAINVNDRIVHACSQMCVNLARL